MVDNFLVVLTTRGCTSAFRKDIEQPGNTSSVLYTICIICSYYQNFLDWLIMEIYISIAASHSIYSHRQRKSAPADSQAFDGWPTLETA
jgi:hypothetical protein